MTPHVRQAGLAVLRVVLVRSIVAAGWRPWREILLVTAVATGVLIWRLDASAQAPAWELANPLVPLAALPLGIDGKLTDLKRPPTPERVRLGRWLFFDRRLSADGTLSCASCHVPEHAFSEPSAVSTGIRGQKGRRKAPSFINQAWTLYPHFFWDGRAGSLQEQALGPIANPIEMGNTHENMLGTLRRSGYGKYFKEAFGTDEITKERVARAITDYERTRMSGNSPWDRWRKKRDESAVSADVKKGHDLF
ncbi:MAG: cytochrome-c peroxidase, partial [Acidobacteria bacterium]|nr:cytochrome-c peroxidase [Acidobacteriota bacterium]